MLGIYENDVRESINNGAWLSSVKDCNFSSEWSRLICEAGRWCESYASHVYRAVWRWSFTVEEREYGPYIVSKLEKLLVI